MDPTSGVTVAEPRPRLRARTVVGRLLALVVGVGLGLFAGLGLSHDLPEAAYRVDLLPAPGDWSAVYALVVAGWVLGLALACFSRRWRYVAIGWCLGVPVWLVIGLVYNYVVWGLWGESPTIP